MLKEIPVKFRSGYAFHLRFTMDIWEKLENEICVIGDIGDKISEGKERLHLSVKIAAIMASEENITEETIWKSMEPRDMRDLNQAIMKAIAENLVMETEKDGEGDTHDVVLEEIEAKKEKAG